MTLTYSLQHRVHTVWLDPIGLRPTTALLPRHDLESISIFFCLCGETNEFKLAVSAVWMTGQRRFALGGLLSGVATLTIFDDRVYGGW